jgi:hypothetical protein
MALAHLTAQTTNTSLENQEPKWPAFWPFVHFSPGLPCLS